jgi:hypothetical protein
MAVDIPEMVVKLVKSHADKEMVSKMRYLWEFLMEKYYALLRMRPLSISYAEDFHEISPGKSNMTNPAIAAISWHKMLA